MKPILLKFAAILLMLTWGFSSCETEEGAPKEGPQAVNLLSDLPWLKEIVEGLEKDLEAGNLYYATIEQCTYKDGTGFLIETCAK